MKWATGALIHFDRVVSAWLILRFVDPDARFTFLTESAAADDDTTVFGVRGARLGPHNGDTTTFQRIVDVYSLSDPGLALLGKIVAEVIDHVI